nr:alpha/beta fold hydrolase [Jannaschia sp. Os4]
MEVAAWGPPPAQAPTLVLLHEGLGSVGLWRDWPDALVAATGLGALAYSRAGHGRSVPHDGPRDASRFEAEAARVLPAVLDGAGVGRCILLGHSDGATIAALHAGRVADPRVRGLILVAPHFFAEPEGLSAIAATKRAFDGGDLRSRMAKHHDDPDAAFGGWAGTWLDPAFADWDVTDAIDHWRIPALVIQGDADPYGSLAHLEATEARSYAPVERLVLPGVGHAPHHEARDATTGAVAAFCARLMAMEARPGAPA